jgi:hypothetical protein
MLVEINMCVKALETKMFLAFFKIDNDYLGRMPRVSMLGLSLLISINFCYILEFGDLLGLMYKHE